MKAKASLNNREEMVAQCIEELEQDMELLAITGVEGKLFLRIVTSAFNFRQTTRRSCIDDSSFEECWYLGMDADRRQNRDCYLHCYFSGL